MQVLEMRLLAVKFMLLYQPLSKDLVDRVGSSLQKFTEDVVDSTDETASCGAEFVCEFMDRTIPDLVTLQDSSDQTAECLVMLQLKYARFIIFLDNAVERVSLAVSKVLNDEIDSSLRTILVLITDVVNLCQGRRTGLETAELHEVLTVNSSLIPAIIDCVQVCLGMIKEESSLHNALAVIQLHMLSVCCHEEAAKRGENAESERLYQVMKASMVRALDKIYSLLKGKTGWFLLNRVSGLTHDVIVPYYFLLKILVLIWSLGSSHLLLVFVKNLKNSRCLTGATQRIHIVLVS